MTNWPVYDASLRQRGSLTGFTEKASAAWAAEPSMTLSGQGEWLFERHTGRHRAGRGVPCTATWILTPAKSWSPREPPTTWMARLKPILCSIKSDQVAGPVASFTGDSVHDQDRADASVAERPANADIIMSPRANAVPSGTAKSEPTQRGRRLRIIKPAAWLGRNGRNTTGAPGSNPSWIHGNR